MTQVAFLFPGQGAQTVGMAKELCESSSEARAVFHAAADVLGYDLADLCFHGPQERLDATEISQPAIFTASWAALAQLRETQPELVDSCAAAAGLSLGEYTALAFAGALSFEDALRTVHLRGQAMQQAAEATPGAMASVLGLERGRVESLCSQVAGRVWVANLLGPGNIVVSGEVESVHALGSLATEAGAMKVVPLAVAGAFHTEIMQPADRKLADALAGTAIKTPRIPVISNVTAQPHCGTKEIGELLVRQVLAPVLWEDSMKTLIQQGCDRFCEVGPGRVLRGLLRRIDRKVQCDNYGG